MSRYLYFVIVYVLIGVALSGLYAQAPSKPLGGKPDYSQEAFVTELDSTRVVFENDGTSNRESSGRIRIQSEAGVQRYGVLTFSYQGSTDTVDLDYVRVRKPDGTVVTTPPENVQDMPADITRQAPFYSDLREKHVSVKGMGVGDVLEFLCRWRAKPLAAGQFWLAYNFSHDHILLQEQLQVSVPKNRPVKWKSVDLKAAITEEGTRRVFTWVSSQLEAKSAEQERKDKELALYRASRGKFPQADVQISSFQSWEEVGRWFNSLLQERVKPTPEIRSKAAELTKGSTDEATKLRAIYNYVSTQFRYIGIAFGIGRYQPHPAAEVLANQYGDCKDKHTLLASLLSAVGIKAHAALIASTREVDPDVPSPVQFDHIITAVAQGKDLLWLDTTSEVAPFGYLLSGLYDKKALLIPDDGPPLLTSTPTDPPGKALQTFRIHAKLNDSGTLEGKVERSFQGGDNEVLVRAGFRSLPATQWKDLIQQISYGSGFGGDVNDVSVTSPEKTEEPFRFSYNYTRKDYSEWSNRRISAPLPTVAFPLLTDKDSEPSYPIWLGSPAEIHFESSLELPKGYTLELPKNVDLKEDFAEYRASYAVKDGVLTAERRLVVKLREVPVKQQAAFKKFSKAVSDDHDFYIALSASRSPGSYQEDIWKLPYSENREAARAYDEARELYKKHDPQGEIASLKRAVEIDPKFTRAWLWLGEIYKYQNENEHAVQTYRKALDIDPKQPVGYKALGFTLLSMKKFEEAVPVWQALISLAPDDASGSAGLGSAMLGLKRYRETVTAFEAATKLSPELAGFQVQLGSAHLLAGDADMAEAAYQKAIELDPQPGMLNHIAYELAEANTKLSLALDYAQKAVSKQEEASRKVKLSELQNEDLRYTASLGPFWDTLGWVHFRLGDLDQAEKYLEAAWTLSLDSIVGDHLGQLFERQSKKQAAVRMYRLALNAYSTQRSGGEEAEKTRQRLERLSPGAWRIETFAVTSERVNAFRTVKLPRLVQGTANAEFFLLLAPDPKTLSPKVEDVKFVSGSEELKSAGKALMSATFQIHFPDDGPRLLRRGILACYEHTGCSFTLYKPSDVYAVN